MPFSFDEFIVNEETFAFKVLIDRYNIALKDSQKIIDLQRLYCNDKLITVKNQKISGNMKVLRFMPKSKGLKAIFKSKDFLIFDKPNGVLVHPKDTKTPYSLLDEIRHYGGELANPVHRIDMETSGLVLASKHKKAENILKVAFEKKLIKKSYLAWVRGNFRNYLLVDEPIKVRNDYSISKHKVEINSSGKKAVTEFKKIYYDKNLNASLIEAIPHTGRTHQIRIHLFHVKHPIIGDPLYGTNCEFANKYLDNLVDEQERVKNTGAKRLMLHANKIDFDFEGIRYIIKSKIDFKFSAKDSEISK